MDVNVDFVGRDEHGERVDRTTERRQNTWSKAASISAKSSKSGNVFCHCVTVTLYLGRATEQTQIPAAGIVTRDDWGRQIPT